MDVAANDLSAAADSLAKINAVWSRLKPVITAHNGSSTAAQFDDSLKSQQSALDKKDTSALTSEASNSLELVDALERLF